MCYSLRKLRNETEAWKSPTKECCVFLERVCLRSLPCSSLIGNCPWEAQPQCMAAARPLVSCASCMKTCEALLMAWQRLSAVPYSTSQGIFQILVTLPEIVGKAKNLNISILIGVKAVFVGCMYWKSAPMFVRVYSLCGLVPVLSLVSEEQFKNQLHTESVKQMIPQSFPPLSFSFSLINSRSSHHSEMNGFMVDLR